MALPLIPLLVGVGAIGFVHTTGNAIEQTGEAVEKSGNAALKLAVFTVVVSGAYLVIKGAK